MCRPSGCTPRVHVFSQGILFLPIIFVCLLSGMLFNLIVSYVFLQGIQSQAFLIVFYVLSGSGSGSPGGTTPSILGPGQSKFVRRPRISDTLIQFVSCTMIR